jgi:glycerol-3-phosphate dehydrogenase (NAD+)
VAGRECERRLFPRATRIGGRRRRANAPPPTPPAHPPARPFTRPLPTTTTTTTTTRNTSTQAVCFDVDCTLTTGDALDLLATWKGVGVGGEAATARPTAEEGGAAPDASPSPERALARRLELLDCSPRDVREFLRANPPEDRLLPGAARLVSALQARGVAVYLVSGGFRELTLPLARALGVPKGAASSAVPCVFLHVRLRRPPPSRSRHRPLPPEKNTQTTENVFANRMLWRTGGGGGVGNGDDDDDGGSDGEDRGSMLAPTRLAGFDLAPSPPSATARDRGKPGAVRLIRRRNPYATIVMVGDGVSDLEAVRAAEGGADLFIGFGGVAQRPAVAAGADWFVLSHDRLADALRRYRVAMVGAGAWASAAARLLAQNTAGDRDAADRFVDEVRMWVFDDDLGEWPGCGGKTLRLSEAINATHENPKYLPGVKLGDNVVADPDLERTVRDADILVLCVPHQFVRATCKKIMGKTKPGAIAISLIKGMRVTAEGPQLISQMVTKYLGMDCSVLMVRRVRWTCELLRRREKGRAPTRTTNAPRQHPQQQEKKTGPQHRARRGRGRAHRGRLGVSAG